MFNLEQAIAEWRQEMLSGGINKSKVLDELESHLRDHVEQQKHSALSEKQAFESAVQQIGALHVLKKEFVKMSLLDSRRMTGFRLYMIAINFFAALVTSPNVVIQLLMFISLQLLYEAIIWVARYLEYNAKKQVQT